MYRRIGSPLKVKYQGHYNVLVHVVHILQIKQHNIYIRRQYDIIHLRQLSSQSQSFLKALTTADCFFLI